MRRKKKKEEQVEHTEPIEPLTDTSLSNDKEVSIEAHSFIIFPLESLHEPQALVLQCLGEPSYAKILKDICTQARKSWNHRPKKNFRSQQVGFLKWRNILRKCYIRLKKKGWKGLVGHPNDRGRYGNFYFYFYFSLLISEFFFIFHFISCYFIFFLTTINLLMFVSIRKYCC
jgi:hypothetical protein